MNGMCDVCGKRTPIGVAASSIGPMSFAYCRSCLEERAEPYFMVVTTLACCGGRLEGTADWFKDMIVPASLEVAGKTVEDLLRDSQDFINEMNAVEAVEE